MSIRIALAERCTALGDIMHRWCEAEKENEQETYYLRMVDLYAELAEVGEEIGRLTIQDRRGQPRVEHLIRELRRIDRDFASVIRPRA